MNGEDLIMVFYLYNVLILTCSPRHQSLLLTSPLSRERSLPASTFQCNSSLMTWGSFFNSPILLLISQARPWRRCMRSWSFRWGLFKSSELVFVLRGTFDSVSPLRSFTPRPNCSNHAKLTPSLNRTQDEAPPPSPSLGAVNEVASLKVLIRSYLVRFTPRKPSRNWESVSAPSNNAPLSWILLFSKKKKVRFPSETIHL